MRCKRCNGLMVVDLCVDEELEEQVAGRGVLRCINCGAVVNVRILRNLAAQRAEGLTLSGQAVPRGCHSAPRLP
ncbi:MAG: hypothetical protein HP492_17810 [Nitrospira sp.]|nr:hypothetical protein [Nitrospira sp.]